MIHASHQLPLISGRLSLSLSLGRNVNHPAAPQATRPSRGRYSQRKNLRAHHVSYILLRPSPRALVGTSRKTRSGVGEPVFFCATRKSSREPFGLSISRSMKIASSRHLAASALWETAAVGI